MQKCDVCLPVSPGPGRPSDPEKDRQILAAARSLLFSGGPRALTMDAVAREARVSKATLYARHSNRQALLVAVVCEEAHGIGHALCQRPDNRESMIEDLVSFITALLAFVGSPPHARLLQVMGEVTPDVSDLSALFANGAQNALERLAASIWRRRTGRSSLSVISPSGRPSCSSAWLLAWMWSGRFIANLVAMSPLINRPGMHAGS